MVFKDVMKVGDAPLLPFGEIDGIGALCSWKSGLCQMEVSLHGASVALVILLAFHQAVRVVCVCKYNNKSSAYRLILC